MHVPCTGGICAAEPGFTSLHSRIEAMAAGGQSLGGELARQADGHAADARLISEAWPSQTPIK